VATDANGHAWFNQYGLDMDMTQLVENATGERLTPVHGLFETGSGRREQITAQRVPRWGDYDEPGDPGFDMDGGTLAIVRAMAQQAGLTPDRTADHAWDAGRQRQRHRVTGIFWAVFGVLGMLAMTALGDMVSEEVRDRLDHLPRAILRLACRRLDPELRDSVYGDEWLPELTYILRGDESRPFTRLFHGTRFAVGIALNVQRIAGYPGIQRSARTTGISFLSINIRWEIYEPRSQSPKRDHQTHG
jgi:hypothetical protein